MIRRYMERSVPGKNEMSISNTPSVVTLPNGLKPYPSILDFLVTDVSAYYPEPLGGTPASKASCWTTTVSRSARRRQYVPSRRIFYFREVENEPVIPFAETILFQDDELLVACKPHFLPVIPGGRFVNECLLNRLRVRSGIQDLTPLHRIDRETAGIVIFSVNKKSRGLYHDLFMHGKVTKTYHALAEWIYPPQATQWVVENRIVRGEPRFKMKTVPGVTNARSTIQLVEVKANRARFQLHPVTGKTHQLRLHMSELGFTILHDRVYPVLQAEQDDDFARPLQLLAKMVQFRDPVTGQNREFRSGRELAWSC